VLTDIALSTFRQIVVCFHIQGHAVQDESLLEAIS